MPRAALVALLCTGSVRIAAAQQPAAPAGSQAPVDAAAVARLIEDQRQLLESQARLIEELTRRLEETSRQVAAGERRLTELESRSSTTPDEQPRLAAIEEPRQTLPELAPHDPSESGDFPGALRIPGTDSAIRFGGQVRTLLVRNLGALGTDDRFVTSSIPVEGSPEAAKDSRMTLSASPSRLETDFRTQTPVGPLRAFLSGDFAGSNRTYRLRHAFGQWRGFLIGQTWSTFSDPEAEPDGLDFEGLNAISLFRQPIVRWTTPLGERVEFSAALENPSPDITGASGVNQVPDVIARLRVNYDADQARRLLFRGGGGHTQAALLVRQIRGEADSTPDRVLATWGIGVHVSGRVQAPWRRSDYLKFANALGRGIGRYITDLGTLGAQDAVYDPERHALVALPVYSTYVGYEHAWSQTIRSTLTFGAVFVDNLDIQDPGALRRTTRSSVNVAWSPVQSVDLIAELLAGRRVNKDGQDGHAGQFQLGWIFRF